MLKSYARYLKINKYSGQVTEQLELRKAQIGLSNFSLNHLHCPTFKEFAFRTT